MRAGQLDRVIVIQRATETLSEAGAPVVTWGNHLTMRAQIIEAKTDEVMRNPGEISEILTVFRTRFADDITPADRIAYAGRYFNIKGTKELGRRAGLEIRALSTEAA